MLLIIFFINKFSDNITITSLVYNPLEEHLNTYILLYGAVRRTTWPWLALPVNGAGAIESEMFNSPLLRW